MFWGACAKYIYILFSSSLVPNDTMTLSGRLSVLQFSHDNMSPKLALKRYENWKGFKMTTDTMLKGNKIPSYFITYLPFISALLSFWFPKTEFSVPYLHAALVYLCNPSKYKAGLNMLCNSAVYITYSLSPLPSLFILIT